MPSADIAVERYTPAQRREIAALFEILGLLDEAYPLHAQWRAALDGATSVFMPLLVGRRNGQACGVAGIFQRPTGVSGRVVAVEVAAPERRGGVGSALVRAVSRELARTGIARQIVAIFGDRPGPVAFLTANGFRLYETAFAMEWRDTPYPVEAGEIPCIPYDGGDAALDREIADLLNTVFRGDTIAGPISGEDLRRLIDGYGAWFVTARNPATGTLVGVAECHANGLVCSLAVARKFWGTGLSRRLVCGCLDRFRAAGRRDAFSLVRATNTASIRLQEGLGWRRGFDLTFYAAETGAAT